MNHKYAIWKDKKGYYYTSVPDVCKKGRKQIRRKSVEEIERDLPQYYAEYHAKLKRIAERKNNLDERRNLISILKSKISCENLSKTKLYISYSCMKSRCYNKKNVKYDNYGGRGIRVCDDWIAEGVGVWRFMLWALNNGYRDGLTLDRIDVNGDYEPDNCRWADRYEQANNRTDNVKYKYNGFEMTASEIARIESLPKYKLYRLLKKGVAIEMAVKQLKAE